MRFFKCVMPSGDNKQNNSSQQSSAPDEAEAYREAEVQVRFTLIHDLYFEKDVSFRCKWGIDAYMKNAFDIFCLKIYNNASNSLSYIK